MKGRLKDCIRHSVNRIIRQIPLDTQIGQFFLRKVIIGHAAFLHHAPGSIIPCKEGSVDSTKSLFEKQIFEESTDCLSGIAVAPITRADPIADLTGILTMGEMK